MVGKVASDQGKLRIAILAVQGDYEAHGRMLEHMGVEYRFVRAPEELEGCDGLILPGGESTTQLQFLEEEGLRKAVEQFVERGGAIFGTCAGAILLAREVQHPEQASLGMLDMTVVRNAYGRQIASDVVSGPTTLKREPLEMVFIRGPVIERVGPGTKVLAEYAGKPVLVEQGRVLVATFHPELTEDTTVHRHFLDMAAGRNGKEAAVTARKAPVHS